MIREIAHGNNFPDTGFVLQMIMKSKYLKSMREMVGKDLTKIIADELRGNYLPYVDPRFRSLKRFFQENRLSPPFLEDDMENQMGYHPIMGEPGKPLDIMHPEIEPWYHRYLGMRRSLRTK